MNVPKNLLPEAYGYSIMLNRSFGGCLSKTKRRPIEKHMSQSPETNENQTNRVRRCKVILREIAIAVKSHQHNPSNHQQL